MVDTPGRETVLITGSAGFIGSHLADALLQQGFSVVGIDNLSRGTLRNLHLALAHPQFQFLKADLTDLDSCRKVLAKFSIATVWHLAANSDIPAGVADPNADFRDTFLSTYNTLLAMKDAGVRKLIFASSSAIYGVHDQPLTEDTGPLFPISNYGAMKLASEGLISAALESYLKQVWIFRFPNVIGSRATHGIVYDLLAKLKAKPQFLEVLGDGSQQKPYLHVSELLDAMFTGYRYASERLNYFNIGAADDGATVRYIAEAVQREAAPLTPLLFTGGNRGWVGDVPRFQYSIDKIARLGWRPKLSSTQAVDRAVSEIYRECMQCS